MAYKQMYRIEVRHEGLHKYRAIQGSDLYVIRQKAAAQRRVWDEMSEKRQEAERKRKEREATIRDKEQKIQMAAERTAEAEESINALQSILDHTLHIDDTIDWESLLDHSDFAEVQPKEPDRKSVV